MPIQDDFCCGFRRALPTVSEADVDRMWIDRLIVWIDRLVFRTLTAVLQHPDFQRLESRWRGLWYLVDSVGATPLVQVHLLSISKDALVDDFRDAAELYQCGLFHHLYRQEYDQYGGIPFAAVLVDYEFDRGGKDFYLLERLSEIGMSVHAPFIGMVGPRFFGLDGESWSDLPGVADLHDIFNVAEYRKWRSFQHRENARYLALMLNRFLVRTPYHGVWIRAAKGYLTYDERRWDKQGKGYVFANPVYGLGAVLARAFIRTGWCTDIFGSSGAGVLYGVPLGEFSYGKGAGHKITTELLVTNRLERQLAELGLLPLVHDRFMERPCMLSSRTVQAMRYFRRDPLATGSWTITSRLPFVLMVSRMAHYLKVHQRENLGSLKEAPDIERELQGWLKELVVEDSSPSPEVRQRYPFRSAQVRVRPIPDDPGRLRVELLVQPHYQLENINVHLYCDTTLSISTGTAAGPGRSARHG